MATTDEPLDQRLRNGTTWYIIKTQNVWWRTRSEGWVRVATMRIAHKLHTLGWLEDHAAELLTEEASRLYSDSGKSLFGDDLVAEADYLADMAANDVSAKLAVRTTPFYKRLMFDLVDQLGTGEK